MGPVEAPWAQESQGKSTLTARQFFYFYRRRKALQPRATSEHILSVVRNLGYVQLDPINVVAPSHVIVFWNRVGNFQLSDLDRLLCDGKKLFEHWAHAASIVLTEDYPLYYSMMRRYPESLSKSWGAWKARARKWLPEHTELREDNTERAQEGTTATEPIWRSRSNQEKRRRMELWKRCFHNALPPADERRSDGSGPRRKSENRGSI